MRSIWINFYGRYVCFSSRKFLHPIIFLFIIKSYPPVNLAVWVKFFCRIESIIVKGIYTSQFFLADLPSNKQPSPITKETTINNSSKCQSTTHQKKSRTVFTKKQILRLESVFYEKRYLTIKDREELSKSLSLTESQVNH